MIMQWWWLMIVMAIWVAPDKLLVMTVVEGSTPNYPLPPGWTAHVHEGRPYYHHYESGISQWEEPLSIDKNEKEMQQQQQQQSESHKHMNFPQNHVSSSVLGGTSWEEEALLGVRWRPGAQVQGEGEELACSEIRGSPVTEEIIRLNDDNEVLRKELDRERALVDASASNLTSIVGELVQAVTDRGQLLVRCTTLQHEFVNATTMANKLSRHLSLSKLRRTKLSEDVMLKNNKIKELEERIEELIEDMGALDKALGQYMEDGRPGGNSMTDSFSWDRIKKTLLDPLVPESIRGPTVDELEILSLRAEIKRSHANATVLSDALSSKSDLISELNTRISRFEDDGAKRRSTLAKLKSGIDDLTVEVEQKKMEISDLLLERKLFAGGFATALAGRSEALILLQAAECATLSIQEELNVVMEDRKLREEKEEEERRVARQRDDVVTTLTDTDTSNHPSSESVVSTINGFMDMYAFHGNGGPLSTDIGTRNESTGGDFLPLSLSLKGVTTAVNRWIFKTEGCYTRHGIIRAWREEERVSQSR